jgi:serine/threonine-protein kinase
LAAVTVLGAGVYWASHREAGGSGAEAGGAIAAKEVSIAVLPFVDLSPESDQAYFADGLTEELIDALTRVRGLRVAPRGPTAKLSGLSRDVRQVGRELNVSAVLDGSVRKAGDRLRIAVRVSDVSNGYTLWAEMYERHVSDVFAVQEDISQKIVRSLGSQLGVAQNGRPIMRSGTTSIRAFNFYLKGRYHWNRRGEDSLRKAISYFELAIREDPRYAAAYSGLADAYGGLTHQTAQAPGQLVSKDKEAALKALEIDSELPEAHASLGRASIFDDWDFAAAEKSLKRALEIDPQYATAYQWYSVLLMLANRNDEALQYMKRAEELEPLHPNIKRAAGDLHYRRGEYDEAIHKCREAIELDNRLDGAYICVGRSFEQKGDYRQALETFEKGSAVSKRQDLFLSLRAHTHGVAGNTAEAKRLVEELRVRAQRGYVSPYYFAVAHAGLRDREQTLTYLEKALAERSVWVIALATDLRFQFLQGDPRFAAITSKLPTLSRAGQL